MAEEGPSALAAFCAAHPLQAEALRAALRPLLEVGLLETDAAAAPGVPQRLGGFRLLRRLGGGGMGVVYLAEQEDTGRRVAVKLIRPEHLYFPSARERFRREAAAVARLQHPGIAQVYEAGEESGLPFYAMEYLEGQTLAEALRRLAGRPLAELSGADLAGAGQTSPLFTGSWEVVCLRVAREVAEALEHAHRRGVLHRDVKPSNVLITPAGRVVLLDFGLASAEGEPDMTRSGAQPGSLPYMSPEQLRGDKQRIDQRTDVYSLGVTLFELLTLRAPFAAGDGEQTRRDILEGRLPRPRELNPALSRAAETVCLAALDCQRDRRYPSAAALALDLDQCLGGAPLAARRPSPWRRAWRRAARSPAAALAVAAAFLAVVVAPSFVAWREWLHGQRARQDLARKERFAGLLEQILLIADPDKGHGSLIRMDELLDEAAVLARSALGGEALELARMLVTLGKVNTNLSRLEAAEALFREALELRGGGGAAAALLAEAEFHLGEVLGQRAQFRAASDYLDRALRRWSELQPPPPDRLGAAHAQLASVLEKRSDYTAAAAHFRSAQRIYERNGDLPRQNYILVLSGLAQLLETRGELEEAERLAELALEMHAGLPRPDLPQVLDMKVELALIMRKIGLVKQPEEMVLEAIAGLEQALDGDHLYLAKAWLALAKLRYPDGRADAAEQALQQGRAVLERCFPEGHALYADLWRGFGQVHLHRKDLERAAESFRAALDYAVRFVEPTHPDLGSTMQQLAHVLLWQRRYDEAEEWCYKALAVFDARPDRHPLRADPLFTLGQVAEMRQRFGEARARYEEALAAISAFYPEGHAYRGPVLQRLALLCMKDGDNDRALEMLEQVVAAYERRFQGPHPAYAEALGPLAALKLQSGAVAEGRRLLEKSLEMNRQVFGPDAVQTRMAEFDYASQMAADGQAAPALAMLQRVAEGLRASLGAGHPSLAVVERRLREVEELAAAAPSRSR